MRFQRVLIELIETVFAKPKDVSPGLDEVLLKLGHTDAGWMVPLVTAVTTNHLFIELAVPSTLANTVETLSLIVTL